MGGLAKASYLDALEELAKVLDSCLDPLSMSSDLVPCTSKFLCDICRHHYNEPRVLPCLHSFCTACLEKIETFTIEDKETEQSAFKRKDSLRNSLDSFQLTFSKNSLDTSASGYETEKSCLIFTNGKNQSKDKSSTEKTTVLCPSCNSQVHIPNEGVKKLPLNYLLQHETKLDNLAKDVAAVCCDLCNADIPSVAFCENCQLSLCSFCAEAHRRQKKTSHHEMQLIQEAMYKGMVKMNRKICCPSHGEQELNLFCQNCFEVICTECLIKKHQGHQCDDITDTADKQITVLKLLLSQMKPQLVFVKKGLSSVHQMSRKLTTQVAKVTDEVNRFTDDYLIALETHRQNLLRQVQRVQVGRQRVLRLQRIRLEQMVKDLEDWEEFVEHLLEKGTETEILGLYALVQHRWEELEKLKTPLEPQVDDTLQFDSKQRGCVLNGYVLQGTINTQSVCPNQCLLKGNGLHSIREGEKTQLLLLTRDTSGQPVIKGHSNVQAYLALKASDKMKVDVTDRTDGSYVLSFTPNSSGTFHLHVSVNGKHIKGSPFPIVVKPQWQQHTGIFHCCSFCSSEGDKDAYCACGGIMPGGFKGCGHGHSGHPGQKHWSCCGKTSERSECLRPKKEVYEFTI